MRCGFPSRSTSPVDDRCSGDSSSPIGWSSEVGLVNVRDKYRGVRPEGFYTHGSTRRK